jgi:carboxyl-terminal processing protease
MWKVVRIAAPLLLVILFIVAYVGAGCDWEQWVTSPTEREFDIIEEAWQIILDDFVDSDELDLNKLSQSAIEGMIGALDDPYSAYYDAEDYALTQGDLEGSFGGIGVKIRLDEEGQLTVVAPLVGSPAQREGIMAGDKILEIDGETTEGLSLTEATFKVRGELGTQVTLRILHQGEDVPQDIVITREKIELASVLSSILADNIAHIEVSHFSSRTGSEIISALEDITAEGVSGIILDLRDNVGGVLDAAVDLASQFLKEGVILYVIDGKGNRETWEVRKGGLATDLPLAVLVNGLSASASEIVAGALQDHGRGVIIGTKTLGKGSVNHFHQLSDGSAIYITTARWYTPNERQIEGQGILPDVTVEITAEDIEAGYDPQLERAIEYIKSQL